MNSAVRHVPRPTLGQGFCLPTRFTLQGALRATPLIFAGTMAGASTPEKETVVIAEQAEHVSILEFGARGITARGIRPD